MMQSSGRTKDQDILGAVIADMIIPTEAGSGRDWNDSIEADAWCEIDTCYDGKEQYDLD